MTKDIYNTHNYYYVDSLIKTKRLITIISISILFLLLLDSISVSSLLTKQDLINENSITPDREDTSEFLTTYDFNGISAPSTTHKAIPDSF